MRRTRSIEDRIWCFAIGDPDAEGPGSEDPSEGLGGPGGAADSESRGGPGGNDDGPSDGSESVTDSGFDPTDRTGTVDDPAYGKVENVTTNDDGSMTGVENFNPEDLPKDFSTFIGIDESTTLFGTQDTTGLASEGGFAFSTNTPLSREAMTWVAAAVLPFGGALKALGVLGPFHPDEHIPSSVKAEIDEFLEFLSGKPGGLTPEQEEELRKKYGIPTETEETEETDLDHGIGEGGETVNEETETETTTAEPPKSPLSTLGGHEIYVNGGFQVNYRAVEHVMRGVGEINFTTDAIRQLLEPPPGIGLEGGIPVYPLPVTMDTPEEVTMETYPPGAVSVDTDREPAYDYDHDVNVEALEALKPTLPPAVA